MKTWFLYYFFKKWFHTILYHFNGNCLQQFLDWHSGNVCKTCTHDCQRSASMYAQRSEQKTPLRAIFVKILNIYTLMSYASECTFDDPF